MRQGKIISISATLGATAVILGAFGAHALKARVEERMLLVFETAVRYQMYHALAIGLIAALSMGSASKRLTQATYFMTVGTLIFSGSLYALVASGFGPLGAITPLGGVCLIIGWILLILEGISRKD